MGPMDNVNIGKGQAFRALDEAWATLTIPQCDELLLQLENPNQSYVDTREQELMITAAMANHIRTHWYGSTEESFWPNKEKKEEIVRAAYAQGIKLVRSELQQGNSLPVVVYWICAGHHFEAIVCKSSVQVTVLILTPSVSHLASRHFPANDKAENIWMIGTSRDIDRARAPSLENWFGRHDKCGAKDDTAFDGVSMTQIFGN